MKNLEHMRFSILFTIVGFVLAYFVGGFEALFVVAVLSVMEVSLSFDNAVVNATVLKDMDEKWQQRFLTWGILIAVFGMRVVFPVLVVCVAATISPFEAIDIAINDHALYASYMVQEHVPLMGFGAGFLMLVGLNFFIDDEKEEHWLAAIEAKLAFLGTVKFLPLTITFLSMYVIALLGLEGEEFKRFMVAGMLGMFSHELIGMLSSAMERSEDKRIASAGKNGTAAVAKSGFAMFMYLEVLDASFSFDGVIGAFAITNDIFIIAIGLGIGAMFVRSLTIMLVKSGSLTEYRYLEHGAFYAIVALAIVMMIKSFCEVPEVVTGTVGFIFIAVAFIHSLIVKRAEKSGTEQAEQSDVTEQVEQSEATEQAEQSDVTEQTKQSVVKGDCDD